MNKKEKLIAEARANLKRFVISDQLLEIRVPILSQKKVTLNSYFKRDPETGEKAVEVVVFTRKTENLDLWKFKEIEE